MEDAGDTMGKSPVRAFVAAIAILGIGLSPVSLRAAQAGPRAFDTPQQAAEATIAPAEAGDIPALLAIFGADTRDIFDSGDAVKDRNDLARFAAKAREKLQISYDI